MSDNDFIERVENILLRLDELVERAQEPVLDSPPQRPSNPPLQVQIPQISQNPQQLFDESINHPSANRYNTTVSVETIVNSDVRNLKWFTDLQMAYLWCIEQTKLQSNEEWLINDSFIDFANTMDRRWQRGSTIGVCIAKSSSIEYRAYYEPTTERPRLNVF
jgi:hypothetical protein